MDEFARLNEDEMTVDPEYVEMLHERVSHDIEETKKRIKI